MNSFQRRLLFLLFFMSGFSSLVYQVVWTRMAFASFGIITPVLSVVISVFMLGLSIGAWAGGRYIALLVKKTRRSAILFYAGVELMIGLGAFAVPRLFAVGEHFLLATGQTNSWSYLTLSALMLTVSILPWCVAMGATFPLMMAYVREQEPTNTGSFSYLYVANVLGAMSGTLLSAVAMVEVFGFRHTLLIAAAGNFLIAVTSGWLGMARREDFSDEVPEQPSLPGRTAPFRLGGSRSRLAKWILFSTGFCAMAMEVVWTRAFSPVLKTQVYSFALILFCYLGATFLGSWLYRYHLKRDSAWPLSTLLGLLLVTVYLPILATDPRLVRMDSTFVMPLLSAALVLASICPLCALLGYLTPGLIDEYAAGEPGAAGRAYAINVLGCILGPLFASYLLLPHVSERTALLLLGLPFLALYCLVWKSEPPARRWGTSLIAAGVAVYAAFFSRDFVDLVSHASTRVEVRRDYAASVISADPSGEKVLLVNGIGMTKLTPVTKFMVHLPLVFHQGTPKSALILCLGMGTSHRSALSWNIDTTTVELVPAVVAAFGYYHADTPQVLAHPKGNLVIDDGRRYLKRTREKFDVIVVDPPPPPEAAGSSLLYSTEFYDLVKQHLNPHGIFQAWYPGGDRLTGQAVLRSLVNSFPHIRCFPSVEGWGVHVLASMEPIENRTVEQVVARMPPTAKMDLMEWSHTPSLLDYWRLVIPREVPINALLDDDRGIQLTDDDPVNEYFLLRRLGLF